MQAKLIKNRLNYKEAGEFIEFVVTQSFVDVNGKLGFDSLRSEAAKKLAFLKFYTDFSIEDPFKAYEEYKDLDVTTLQGGTFGKEQYKDILTATEKQLEYEKNLLYRDPSKCESTLSIKEGTDE